MNILHVTAWHFSVSRGGTETYIDGLAQALSGRSAKNYFLVLSGNPILFEYENCFHMSNQEDLSALRQKIKDLIVNLHPDRIFIHSSDTWEYLAAEIAAVLQIPFFYFFHASSWLCYQRDLKFLGKKDCRRLFKPIQCTTCVSSHGSFVRGLWRTVGCEVLRKMGLRKSSGLQSNRFELAEKEFIFRHATRHIVFTERDRRLFIENGIAESKILLIPQELGEARLAACLRQAKKARCGIPTFGYVGRCCSIKGCEILVAAALKLPPDLEFILRIYGCDWTDPYCRDLQSMAARDSRIELYELMPPEEIPDKLGSLDVLCIPSLVFETGPLTLREGVYSGCYVAGSDQVGQMDFLLHYGKLIDSNTPEGWAAFFTECIRNIEKIRRSRQDSFPNAKSMDFVAEEILK